MDRQKALEITKDRIESMSYFIPENESESKIKKETTEWLKFIEKILEGNL